VGNRLGGWVKAHYGFLENLDSSLYIMYDTLVIGRNNISFEIGKNIK